MTEAAWRMGWLDDPRRRAGPARRPPARLLVWVRNAPAGRHKGV